MTELEKNIQDYFGVVCVEELQSITALFKPMSLAKNKYFVQAGNSCDKLSFVRSGILRIFNTTADKEVTQWITTPGYFVTELSSFLFNTPARWSIQALSDTELYTISKADYQRLGDTHPKWQEFEKLFMAKCFTILEDRVYSHLSMTAEERYQRFYTNNKELFNQVPLQYLASLLGMSPETLSRLRKKSLS